MIVIMDAVKDYDPGSFAAELLDGNLAPQAFARKRRLPSFRRASPTATSAMWIGSDAALAREGHGLHAPVTEISLRSGLRLSLERAVDIRFSAPNSVSWVWAQSDDEGLRLELQRAMLQAADVAVRTLTSRYPVAHGVEPATGYAAAAVLHVLPQTTPKGAQVPPPLLHVHAVLVTVLGEQGSPAYIDVGAIVDDQEDAVRLAGAAGRHQLGNTLRELGFGLRRTGRYFEIEGVPEGLLRPEASVTTECCGGPVQEERYGRR